MTDDRLHPRPPIPGAPNVAHLHRPASFGYQVLEHIDTPEAKQVLQTLATGAPEARVTREAKVSLERLAKRP
jgi:hypothetical protein